MKKIWLQSIDSTNCEAQRRMPELDNMSVIAAKFQTAGKGQRGNRWISSPGENLMFSIVLKFGENGLPEIKASEQFIVTELITLAVTDYLDSKGVETKIKWPNDIYCKDRKICGILIENAVREGYLHSSIIGAGLNLNQTVFPDDIPNPTSLILESTGLYNETPAGTPVKAVHYDTENELDLLLNYFEKYYNIFVTNRTYLLKELYLNKMYRKDEEHQFIDTSNGKTFKGTIAGIADNSCLVVKHAGGDVHQYAFKEIAYII